MSYQQKDMTGSLFVNGRKESDKHPDYNGSVTVNGVEYWLNGWKKKTKDGKPWLSLALKPKEWKNEKAQERPPLRRDLDDEIPW